MPCTYYCILYSNQRYDIVIRRMMYPLPFNDSAPPLALTSNFLHSVFFLAVTADFGFTYPLQYSYLKSRCLCPLIFGSLESLSFSSPALYLTHPQNPQA